jgi:hypothetical protein
MIICRDTLCLLKDLKMYPVPHAPVYNTVDSGTGNTYAINHSYRYQDNGSIIQGWRKVPIMVGYRYPLQYIASVIKCA